MIHPSFPKQAKPHAVNNFPPKGKNPNIDDAEDMVEAKAGHPPSKAEEAKEDKKGK